MRALIVLLLLTAGATGALVSTLHWRGKPAMTAHMVELGTIMPIATPLMVLAHAGVALAFVALWIGRSSAAWRNGHALQ